MRNEDLPAYFFIKTQQDNTLFLETRNFIRSSLLEKTEIKDIKSIYVLKKKLNEKFEKIYIFQKKIINRYKFNYDSNFRKNYFNRFKDILNQYKQQNFSLYYFVIEFETSYIIEYQWIFVLIFQKNFFLIIVLNIEKHFINILLIFINNLF